MPMITFYLKQDVAGSAAIRDVPFQLEDFFYCHPKGFTIHRDEAMQIRDALTAGTQSGTVDRGRYQWRREEPPQEFAINYVFPYTLEEVIYLLNQHKQRATYEAVGNILDVIAIAVMRHRERNHFNSWVVSEEDELPTDYTDDQKHPDLSDNPRVFHVQDGLLEWLDDHRHLDYPTPVL